MRRFGHGSVVPSSTLEALGAVVPEAFARVAAAPSFGYMFDPLQDDPANLLPEGQCTVKALIELGSTMTRAAGDAELEDRAADPLNSTVPAAYTYLGQFIDHDITLESGQDFEKVTPADIVLSHASVSKNLRTGPLDLDSLYGPDEGGEVPIDPATGAMAIGTVTDVGNPVPGKGADHDLKRNAPSAVDPGLDRAAQIGDPRNDENLVIAQMHLAFLRAHNALIAQGKSFDEARKAIRQHYQWIVLHDYLKKRVADPAIVDQVLEYGPKIFKPYGRDDLFMPVEFSAAAFRFGHSMVRTEYNYNLNFKIRDPRQGQATLEQLFLFTALSGNLFPSPMPAGQGLPTLPGNWIIQWERFLPIRPGVKADPARKLDTRLTPLLASLRDTSGNPVTGQSVDIAPKLAVRNLLRGYVLRVPTGQAVETAVKQAGYATLGSGPGFFDHLPPEQKEILGRTYLIERTPLWFYVLAEAAHPQGGGGNRLGPVGSVILAETFYNLAKFAEDSILSDGFQPADGDFELADLMALAGVVTAPSVGDDQF